MVLAGTEISGETSGPLDRIEVLVLAGGLGTRISSVLGDTPKILAPVNEKTFLDFMTDWLSSLGARKLVLCLGHGADKVLAHLSEFPQEEIEIKTVIEDKPLGTAGALRLANPAETTEPVLVINGDSWVDVNLGEFVTSHKLSGADISILCVGVDDISRYGSCEVDGKSRIVRYIEKDSTRTGPGIISAGIYLFSSTGIKMLMEGTGSSLEQDFLQQLPSGTVHGYVVDDAQFIDIGTPESLQAAANTLFQGDQSSKVSS